MINNKWFKILLIASLALNLAFISVVLVKKFLYQDLNSIKNLRFQSEFSLHKDQKNKLETIMRQFRIQLVQFKQDILEKRMDIIEELSDPECDFEQLKNKTQELNEYENQMNNTFVDTLIRINNLLSSQQRLSFLLKLSRNWFFIHESPAWKQHHNFK